MKASPLAILMAFWTFGVRITVDLSVIQYRDTHICTGRPSLIVCVTSSLQKGTSGRAIGACQTAAQWIAPFERETTHHFYADPIGAGRLQDALDFAPAVKGPNVVIRVPRDESVFQVVAEPTKGIFCTGALRTYLDLWSVGERSREAADFLREKSLRWHQ